MAAWTWLEPQLRGLSTAPSMSGPSGSRPRTYPAGTPGPIAATTLIERDGRAWHESAPA